MPSKPARLRDFGAIPTRAVLAAGAGMDLLLCSGQDVSEGIAGVNGLASALRSGKLERVAFLYQAGDGPAHPPWRREFLPVSGKGANWDRGYSRGVEGDQPAPGGSVFWRAAEAPMVVAVGRTEPFPVAALVDC